MKECGACHLDTPLDEFHRHPNTADRLSPICKPCARERARVSRASNPERYAAQLAAARTSEGRARARARESRRDRDLKRASDRAYRERHKERLDALRRERYDPASKFPRGDARAYVSILRADPCSYCKDGACEAIDHIEAQITGGSSEWSNLTSACKSCNSAKRDRPLLAFLARY